jgi:hypothetical protein
MAPSPDVTNDRKLPSDGRTETGFEFGENDADLAAWTRWIELGPLPDDAPSRHWLRRRPSVFADAAGPAVGRS